MRLKNLTIKGFKSFADETVIHFNDAITGIVGPNGSGKSNIVDAIRWVLGEQKGRELRLEQMSDVIFNGTKKKKEAPLAQVSLTFENTKNLLPTDFNHIEISRLLYRSGDSEYRLNGVTCRLKDITGLFLDTGIGSDSYAIIALNMVEELLSNKESARRKMFEQAAGISKYKARKRESLNKLKATKEDLARIEDLLFEISNNLNDLEKQARRTKRFNELKEKYKSIGLLVQFLSVKSLQEKLDNIEASIQDEIVKLNDEEAAMNLTESEIQQFKKNHLDQEKDLSEFQKKVNEVLDKIRLIESQIQINEQKKSLQNQQIEVLTENILQSASRIELLNEELLKLQNELNLCKVDFDQASTLVSKEEHIFLEKQAQYNLLKTGVDQFQIDKQSLETSVFNLDKESAILENKIENLRSDTERSQLDIQMRAEELSQVEAQFGELSDHLKNNELKLAKVSDDENLRQSKIKACQAEIDEINEKLRSINRNMDAKVNEFDLLRSMVEKMEGFPESMKFLSQNWRKDIPVLSDLIYTPEKYRAAIELYLENYLNYYVVHNEDEAVKAVRLLFNNSKGKANFFILDKFRSKSIDHTAIKGCKPALSVIEVSDNYLPIFQELLDGVYLLEEEEHLEDVIRYPDDVSIISLSGSILKANKTIIGGSVGLFEGKKIGRKKNLEKLEQEIQSLESEAIELSRQLSASKDQLKNLELHDNQAELDVLRRQQTELLQRIAQLDTRKQHFNELNTEFLSRIQSNKLKVEEAIRSQENAQLQSAEKRIQLADLINSIASSDEEFNRISIELSEVTNSFNQAKIELLRWQNKFENYEKDLLLKNGQIQEYSDKLNSDRIKKEEVLNSITNLGLAVEKDREELASQLSFRKTMDSDLNSLESQYYETRNLIGEKESKLKSHQRIISELQSQINSVRDQKAEIKYRIQSAHEKAQLEFMADLSSYTPDGEIEEFDFESLQEKSQYYKTRIENYGEVNPLALEAYEEMKSRSDRIQLQREDILKAQDSLIETIQEIEASATSGFLQAFNQVRVHFQAVFRSLFTEDDDCDLVLVDESDPLECDIDIIAKPKGKRPKSISQLSGGEKTLTAIALLFALYLLKPAPFCIFDEVDAPLDDVNIEKFNSIVRKFSKDSQFIIITHNKLTMADVDVLYGVYMEEQGISSVTAVDFRRYSHEIQLEEMQN